MARLYKLRRDDDFSWSLFPRMVQRCVDFAVKTQGVSVAQQAAIKQELWNRFVQPMGGIFMIAVDGNEIFAHLAGWILYEWGEPYFLGWQVEVDEGRTLEELGPSAMEEIAQWIGEVNHSYEAANSALRVRDSRMYTFRDVPAWARWFQRAGIELWHERSILRWKV